MNGTPNTWQLQQPIAAEENTPMHADTSVEQKGRGLSIQAVSYPNRVN